MMAIELTPENREPITAPVPITLPKFIWLVITARAKALHEGDIDKACQEIFEAGLDSQILMMGVGVMEINRPPEHPV